MSAQVCLFWRTALFVCILRSIILFHLINAKKFYYNGHKVYRVFVNSSSDYAYFDSLMAKHSEFNQWHYATKRPYFVDFSASPEVIPILDTLTSRKSFIKSVLIDDLSKFIHYPNDHGERHISYPNPQGIQSRVRRIVPSSFSLERYNSLQQIEAWLHELQRTYSDVAEIKTIGHSYEKRPILKLKIGRKAKNHVKPSIWIDAGIHSREWISISTALYIINELVTRYNNDSQITQLLNRVDVHVAPVVNPDGYHFSQETNRLWRKTLSKHELNIKGSRKVCVGVDANRNFDYFWGTVNEAPEDSACSDGYPGPKPMSESETASIANAINFLRPQLMAYLTLHSYGQMWLAPWGHSVKKPDNYQRQRDMALLAIDALQSVHGTPYSFGTVSDLLYPAAGTSVDYAHSLNVTYSYAIELRPDESASSLEPFRGFLQSEDQIEPTGRETFAGLITMVQEILDE